MSPWSDGEDPPAPRRPSWGCLAALIVSVVALVVLAIFATRILGTALDGVRIR